MLALLFILVPLVLYVLMFSYETYIAFRRLATHGAYLSATWEITHTLLVITLTNFTWLCSDAMVAVGQSVYWGLSVVAAAFVVRGILYMYLFYVAPKHRHTAADWLFAIAHLVMLVGLVVAIVAALRTLTTISYTINEQLIPYMWPALIAAVIICAIPVWTSYQRK